MPELLPVQPFQENLNQGMCVPASLKMVLSFYGVEKSEAELAKLCQTDPKLGTDVRNMKSFVESLGFTIEIKNESSFEDIQELLKKGVPPMVDWFTAGRKDYPQDSVPDGHMSVVVGLDEMNIYLQDPEIGGLRTISREDFMRVWFDFEDDHITSWNKMIIRQLVAIYR